MNKQKTRPSKETNVGILLRPPPPLQKKKTEKETAIESELEEFEKMVEVCID
jgi:hypothetical protein